MKAFIIQNGLFLYLNLSWLIISLVQGHSGGSVNVACFLIPVALSLEKKGDTIMIITPNIHLKKSFPD